MRASKQPKTKPTPDFDFGILHNGSVFFFIPFSPAAFAWMETTKFLRATAKSANGAFTAAPVQALRNLTDMLEAGLTVRGNEEAIRYFAAKGFEICPND